VRVIASLASRQHGVVARRQLLESGVSRRTIEGALVRGALHPVHLGVYSAGHAVLGFRGRWMAAVLASGPDSVLSHRAAAQLWDLLEWTRPALEVTRPRNFRRRPGIAAHRSTLPGDERTSVDGIPVTSVPRTILDLAAVLGRSKLERAMNEAEVRGLTDRLSLPDLLERHPRRRGAATLRSILDRGSGRGVPVNDLEGSFAALIASHGLPSPRFNGDLAVRGRFIRPDAMWVREKLIVELDGRAVHGTVRAFETDRERDRLLVSEGWRVIRVTWRQLREDPLAVAADLRAALGPATASTL
jgi:very-short-patch-repair endonuclease